MAIGKKARRICCASQKNRDYVQERKKNSSEVKSVLTVETLDITNIQ